MELHLKLQVTFDETSIYLVIIEAVADKGLIH